MTLKHSTPRIALACGALIGLASLGSLPGFAVAHDDVLAAATEPAATLSQGFKFVAKSVGPTVVHITSVQRAVTVPTRAPMRGTEGDMMRRFFGDQLPPGFRGPSTNGRMPERRGTGSGVIVDKSGVILTNNHVIAGADQVLVTLDDGREFEAVVVGTDPETDLAVIRIDAGELPAAPIGDSSKLEAGDWVVAIGTPFGLDHTVTAGIVSATGRSNIGLATYEDFIQTDAAINPGNSGGPLVNLQGEVIGINTAISSRSGGNDGIGFAVPSTTFEGVLQSIRDDGRVERGWLGVSIQALTQDLTSAFDYDGTDGVLVADVVTDSPAASAGLRTGDIVRLIDGKATSSAADLMNAVSQMAPGRTVDVAVVRDGRPRELSVTLGTRPGSAELVLSAPTADPSAGLGMTLQPITPELADRLGNGLKTGVVVTNVVPGGLASGAGLRPGDVILDVAGTQVESVADFKAAIERHDAAKSIRLRMQRGAAIQFVILKPDGK